VTANQHQTHSVLVAASVTMTNLAYYRAWKRDQEWVAAAIRRRRGPPPSGYVGYLVIQIRPREYGVIGMVVLLSILMKSPSLSPQEMTRLQTASTHRRGASASSDEDGQKLRVFFVTEEDPLYVIRFFDIFFAEYPSEEIDISGITIDRPFHEPLWETMRRVRVLYGFGGFFRQGLRFTTARLRGRSIEAVAASAGVPIVTTRSVNRPEYVEQVRAIAPDVIVSVAAPEIFRRELLRIPRLGCINIHSGRLPTYRGMMPTFWQMLRGEPAVTITVHRMAERLDAGDVLATRYFAIKTSDSLDRVIKGTKCEGARLLIEVLRDLRADRAQSMPLDMKQASYFSFPKPEDVRAFRKRGHRLL
jgi:methionyl-tRNA formyltransferase